MTIKECIDIVDNLKPNQYTIKEKVMWLSFIEEIIINEVLKTHEGYDGRYDTFRGYSEDKISVTLIVPSPYDRLYTAYLKMKIDEENGETARYNNSAIMYNSYMHEYRKYYNKTHLPLDASKRPTVMPPKNVCAGLSEAEFENLKKDLTHILTEYFGNVVSQDKLTDAVRSFALNNLEMIKPIKGKDYFNDSDKEEIGEYVNTLIEKALKKAFVKTVTINLYASKWVKVGDRYAQAVSIADATPYSKVDLQPSAEQMVIFYEKDIAFVVENEGGNITVYCIGNKPENSYALQATITEVYKDE